MNDEEFKKYIYQDRLAGIGCLVLLGLIILYAFLVR